MALSGVKNTDRYSLRRLRSNEESIAGSPDTVKVLMKFKSDLFYTVPSFFPEAPNTNTIHHCDKLKFVLKIEEGVITGTSNGILYEDGLIYDYKYQWDSDNLSFSDKLIKYFGEKGSKTVLIEQTGGCKILSSGIYLGGNFSFNYYHFVYEFVSKLQSIEHAAIDQNVPLLVDSASLKIKQLRELLSMFSADRSVVSIDEGRSYRVKELYIASCPNHIAPNYKYECVVNAYDNLFDLNSLGFLRDIFLKYMSKDEFPKRIYLSRRNASNRRRFNEEQVLEVLQRYGFTEVFPENYSVAQQMKMFNDAEIIVSGSGAALTNLICCREDSKVICLVNYRMPFSFFSTIASFAGANFCYLHDRSIRKEQLHDIHDAFTVDTTQLDSLLGNYLHG